MATHQTVRARAVGNALVIEFPDPLEASIVGLRHESDAAFAAERVNAALSAERVRCRAAMCPHCKLGKPLEYAPESRTWRHDYGTCRVPCRAQALCGEGVG